MKEVLQEHRLGCAVACTAALLELSYKEALELFPDGKTRAEKEGFYCRDIVHALNTAGKDYKTIHVKDEIEIPIGSIIYIKKSPRYPAGHYLALGEQGFMDPWINFPRLPRGSGFREKLPSIPQYIIFQNRG